jgi:RNA polymerase sigma-70 factor (ECF subfamily)
MGELKKLPDYELVLLLNESNQKALTEIYNRYWMKLLSVAVNTLKNEYEAEECVQDVFISLWKCREGLELRYQLNTYLWTAIKHQVSKVLAKRYRERMRAANLHLELREAVSPSAEKALLEKELLAAIDATIDRLPEKCKMVYRMSKEEGKSHREIAAEMGISSKTVEGHLTRAYKEINDKLTAVFPVVLICHVLPHLPRIYIS